MWYITDDLFRREKRTFKKSTMRRLSVSSACDNWSSKRSHSEPRCRISGAKELSIDILRENNKEFPVFNPVKKFWRKKENFGEKRPGKSTRTAEHWPSRPSPPENPGGGHEKPRLAKHTASARRKNKRETEFTKDIYKTKIPQSVLPRWWNAGDWRSI